MKISDSATGRGGSSVTPLLADDAVSSSPPLERPAGNATPAHAVPAPTPRSAPRPRRRAPRPGSDAALRAPAPTRRSAPPPPAPLSVLPWQPGQRANRPTALQTKVRIIIITGGAT